MSRSSEPYCPTAGLAALVFMVAGSAFSASPAAAEAAPAAPAQPQTAAQDDKGKPTNPEAIIISGRRSIAGGLMKLQTAAETMSSITPAAISEKITSASPLQLVQTVPGVNFGSSNAYGLAVRNFLSIRGLDQTEIGFMIEGVPGTDNATYFPYSESWADNENISDITVTPGNSRLQDPIINASGGEVIESVRDPKDKFGGMVDGSAGSFKAWRTFGRIDTGYIGDSGIKLFGSYSRTRAGNYVGPGIGSRDHVDVKLVKDWSDASHSSIFFSYNAIADARIPPLSLAQFNNAVATNNFNQYQYAATFGPGVTTNYYRIYIAHKRNEILASNNDFRLSDNVMLHVTPYYKYTSNHAPGEVAFNPASIFNGNQKATAVFDLSDLQAGKLFTQNNVNIFEWQYGVSSDIEAALSATNHLIAGYWFDYWRTKYVSGYNILNQAGVPDGTTIDAQLVDTSGNLISGTNFTAQTFTNQFFVGDTQSFLDERLKLSVGFKELLYKVGGENRVIGATGPITASFSRPMPRLLISYDINPRMQVYGNVTTNARMANVPGTYVTQFSATTGGFATVANLGARPEYTVSGQIGYRYKGPINLDLNAFYMHLADHQVSSLQYVNASLVNTTISAGGETIRGASAEVSTRSYGGLSLYGNAQYLKGTFDDNVAKSGDFLPTKGKDMVLSPRWVANAGARFERQGFFASISGKYVGSQYATFMNDQRMPSFTLIDASLGYRVPKLGALTDPTIRFNLTNIRDKIYAASVASVTTNALATRGINGTLISGSSPLYYIGAPMAAMVTLSTQF